MEGVEPESTTPQHGIPKKVIANHLWNFQYTRRENVVGSTRQPRARRPRITYNKERYLQAKWVEAGPLCYKSLRVNENVGQLLEVSCVHCVVAWC